MCRGSFPPLFDGMATKAFTHHGQQSWREIIGALSGKTHHQRQDSSLAQAHPVRSPQRLSSALHQNPRQRERWHRDLDPVFKKSALRSSNQERTTLPCRHISAIAPKSRSSSCLPFIRPNPSAKACIMPYSIPLCIIFTKWPAPEGPQCSQPLSGAGARIFR